MKRFLKWLGGLIGSVLTTVLVLALLPHASSLLSRIMPDESGAALRTSAVLSQKLTESARLETLHVSEEGVLGYDINAAFIGTVASVNASYTYEASFGIDLRDVTFTASRGRVVFTLPAPVLLSDSLTPKEVYRNDSWYPYFDDQDYEKVMEDERIACREKYLSGEYAAQLWDATIKSFADTVETWISGIHGNVTFEYLRAEQGQS